MSAPAKQAASSSAEASAPPMQCRVPPGSAAPESRIRWRSSAYGSCVGIAPAHKTANFSGMPSPSAERAAMSAAIVAPCSCPMTPTAPNSWMASSTAAIETSARFIVPSSNQDPSPLPASIAAYIQLGGAALPASVRRGTPSRNFLPPIAVGDAVKAPALVPEPCNSTNRR